VQDPTPLTGSKIIVQCKDQRQTIGEPKVREFYGLIVSEGVNKGVFMTTTEFTASARRFAGGKRLELVDGAALRGLERQSPAS
jgi:restriction system protein